MEKEKKWRRAHSSLTNRIHGNFCLQMLNPILEYT